MFGKKTEEIIRLKAKIMATEMTESWYKRMYESKSKQVLDLMMENVELKFENARLLKEQKELLEEKLKKMES